LVKYGRMSDNTNRVKVYRLKDDTWNDKGTGLVSFHKDAENPGLEPLILVSDEGDGHEIIRTSVSYTRDFERQGDRIIMWREPDQDDCALSFQDVENCSQLWNLIIMVQNNNQQEFFKVNKGGDDNSLGGNSRAWENAVAEADHALQQHGLRRQQMFGGTGAGAGGDDNADPLPEKISADSLQQIMDVVNDIRSESERLAIVERLLINDGNYLRGLMQLGSHGSTLDIEQVVMLSRVMRSIALLGSHDVLDCLGAPDHIHYLAAYADRADRFIATGGAGAASSSSSGDVNNNDSINKSSSANGSGNGPCLSDSYTCKLEVISNSQKTRLLNEDQMKCLAQLMTSRFLREFAQPGPDDYGGKTLDNMLQGDTARLCAAIFQDEALMRKLVMVDTTTSPSSGSGGVNNVGSNEYQEGCASAGDDAADTTNANCDGVGGVKKTAVPKKLAAPEAAAVSPSERAERIRMLRECFNLTRSLPFETRQGLLAHLGKFGLVGHFLRLCGTILVQMEQLSGASRMQAADMLVNFTIVFPNEVHAQICRGPHPCKPHFETYLEQAMEEGDVMGSGGDNGNNHAAAAAAVKPLPAALSRERTDGSAISDVTTFSSSSPRISTNPTMGAGSSGKSEDDATGSLLLSAWGSKDAQNGDSILWVVIKRLLVDTDQSVLDNMGDVLRVLFDPEGLGKHREPFLEALYEHYMPWLLSPFKHPQMLYSNLVAQKRGKFSVLTTCRALIDLLVVSVGGHSFKMRYYAPRHNTLEQVVAVLPMSHKVVQLAIIQYLRTVLGAKDNEMVINHIVRHNLLRPVLQMLKTARSKDDMISSAILELVVYVCEDSGLHANIAEKVVRYMQEQLADCLQHPTHAHVRGVLQHAFDRGSCQSSPRSPSVLSQTQSLGSGIRAGSASTTSSDSGDSVGSGGNGGVDMGMGGGPFDNTTGTVNSAAAAAAAAAVGETGDDTNNHKSNGAVACPGSFGAGGSASSQQHSLLALAYGQPTGDFMGFGIASSMGMGSINSSVLDSSGRGSQEEGGADSISSPASQSSTDGSSSNSAPLSPNNNVLSPSSPALTLPALFLSEVSSGSPGTGSAGHHGHHLGAVDEVEAPWARGVNNHRSPNTGGGGVTAIIPPVMGRDTSNGNSSGGGSNHGLLTFSSSLGGATVPPFKMSPGLSLVASITGPALRNALANSLNAHRHESHGSTLSCPPAAHLLPPPTGPQSQNKQQQEVGGGSKRQRVGESPASEEKSASQ
jgi:hypothetical protein